MKKSIGFIALFVGIIDLFTLMILMFTDNIFADNGFSPLGIFCFILWFVCIFTAIFCLAGTFLQYLGKSFGSGLNSQSYVQSGTTVFCPSCGKSMDASMAFCPHCGAKR